MTNLLRVEFHCHTIYSPDSLNEIDDLLRMCEERGIDRVVITDHNTIAGAVAAKQLDPKRVIVGEEIRTTQGELLAAFVQERIPRGLSPFEAIARLREQNAFISVSHPFDRRGGFWDRDVLVEIAPLVDAFEVFNARCLPRGLNVKAQDFAEKHRVAGTVGSDAHALLEVGRATMLLPYFDDAAGLRDVIGQAQFETQNSGIGVRFLSRYAVMRKHYLENEHEFLKSP